MDKYKRFIFKTKVLNVANSGTLPITDLGG